MRSWTSAAALMLLASCATPPSGDNGRPEIALTIDDLPVHGPIPAGETPASVAAQIVGALKQAHVPAYGFVNAVWTDTQPDTLQVLQQWRAAGIPLGNHTWSHKHLSEMDTDQFEQEVTRNEPTLQQLAGGTDWKWFRYPFLDEGENAEKRAAGRAVLARHGYKIGTVTMDFSDWAWTAPYARCRAANDQAAIAKLEQMYLAAAKEAITYYRGLSNRLYGRDIPYVVLLHTSAFEARMMPRLIDIYRSAGFRFVTLPSAEADPYYADQVDPSSPAQPQGLENKAVAQHILLPARTDYQSQLNAICPGGSTSTNP